MTKIASVPTSDYDAEIIDETVLLETVVPISARGLRNWRNRGLIPYIRPPGTRRILYHKRPVIEALLRMQKSG